MYMNKINIRSIKLQARAGKITNIVFCAQLTEALQPSVLLSTLYKKCARKIH